ncbi:peptidase M24 [Delphinella strobiligena]|nr:peptidase M24 [Delphinella strobiligena]
MRGGAKLLRAAWRPRACLPRASFLSQLPRRTIVSAAELQFGQPLHETHPHLIAPGDLTPGISALEYHHRRANLAKSLPKNSVAVLASSDVKYRSGAVFYEFHQEPNFYYLTGFHEPDSVAIIEKGNSDVEYTFHLFVRPKDPKAEQWDGARSGIQAAQDVFNADEAGDVNHIPSLLPQIIDRAKEVYTDVLGNIRSKTAFSRYSSGATTSQADGFQKLLRESNVKPLRPLLNKLRLVKSENEILNMRKAGQISGRVITDAMRTRFSTEKDLWTTLEYGYKINGLDGSAYVPVVAGGQNGLSIHYVRNDHTLKDGEMVLVDSGGEYGGYITDITRTWPVNGKFTDSQRDLYEAILKVQRSVISLCREDADVSLDKLHRITENGLREGLKGLGFDMSGDALDKLFPHHVGHYIGLDVHDAPGYPRTDRLKAGHCVTVEPGIYVPHDDRWPKHFRGLAIRIEDSVAVMEDSPYILTTEAVKEVVDIEALRQ